jgi:hypothetical protein
MDNITFNIYLTFLILIIIIGIGYWIYNEKCLNRGIEGFYTTPTTTTQMPPAATANNTTGKLPDSVATQLANITDQSARQILENQLIAIKQLLDRYTTLDIPITINDSGEICSNWSSYNNGEYNNESNKCLIIDNSNSYKCLDDNGILNNCNKLYTDNYINSRSKINYNTLLDITVNGLLSNIAIINSQINNMNQEADGIINKYADLNNLQIQQLDIISNIKTNMEDKKRIIDENKQKLGEKQNDTNLNQNNFSKFMEDINNKESWNSIYYRVIIGLIITIIVLGILNFLFSNILS